MLVRGSLQLGNMKNWMHPSLFWELQLECHWSDLLLYEGVFTAMEARVDALETSMEFLKKVVSQHTTHLAEIRESVSSTSDIKNLLARWMQKQGLDWDDDAEESEEEKGGPNATGSSHERKLRTKVGGVLSQSDQGARSWTKKVKLPTFEGTDPIGWIARAEKFFEVHGIDPTEKLQLAFISMEGAAVHWFRFWRQKCREHSWDAFTMALIRRFRAKYAGNVYERLATLTQTDSVEEYVQNFEILVAQTNAIPEEQLLGYFLGGLRFDIRCRMRVHNPQEVSQAIEMAQDLEEEFKIAQGWNGQRNTGTFFNSRNIPVTSLTSSPSASLGGVSQQSARSLNGEQSKGWQSQGRNLTSGTGSTSGSNDEGRNKGTRQLHKKGLHMHKN